MKNYTYEFYLRNDILYNVYEAKPCFAGSLFAKNLDEAKIGAGNFFLNNFEFGDTLLRDYIFSLSYVYGKKLVTKYFHPILYKGVVMVQSAECLRSWFDHLKK